MLTKDQTLHDKTLVLAREFETEANKIDAAFLRRANYTMFQGGAIDEEAERLRALAVRRSIARWLRRLRRMAMLTKDQTLHDKTLVLAREFETEANKIDAAFLRRANYTMFQGGAIDEEAERLRALARKLRSIASAVE